MKTPEQQPKAAHRNTFDAQRDENKQITVFFHENSKNARHGRATKAILTVSKMLDFLFKRFAFTLGTVSKCECGTRGETRGTRNVRLFVVRFFGNAPLLPDGRGWRWNPGEAKNEEKFSRNDKIQCENFSLFFVFRKKRLVGISGKTFERKEFENAFSFCSYGAVANDAGEIIEIEIIEG